MGSIGSKPENTPFYSTVIFDTNPFLGGVKVEKNPIAISQEQLDAVVEFSKKLMPVKFGQFHFFGCKTGTDHKLDFDDINNRYIAEFKDLAVTAEPKFEGNWVFEITIKPITTNSRGPVKKFLGLF